MEREPILKLPPGPIDIVGDVHGRLDGLRDLVRLLGYDDDGGHPAGRRLVFVGDLCDRGPDSPGVFRWVMRAAQRNGAVCVLGNHELALIDTDENERQKAGNAWFFGDPAKLAKDRADFDKFELATPEDRRAIEAFCDSLPILVEHPDVTIVHACLDPACVEFVRTHAGAANRELVEASNARAVSALRAAGLETRFPEAKRLLESRRRTEDWAPHRGVTVEEQRLIDDLVPGEYIEQRENPLRVLTSGHERPAPRAAWLGKKWRFMERVPWWQDMPPERPVVFGHYWRQREHLPTGPYDEHAKLFGAARAEEWLGADRLAMCVDYRWPQDWSRAALGAYRPDRGELVFCDGVRLASRWGHALGHA